MQKYDNLLEKHGKGGNFCLQSRIHWANQCLEALHRGKVHLMTYYNYLSKLDVQN